MKRVSNGLPDWTERKGKVDSFKGKLEITQRAFGTLINWENKLCSRVLCIFFKMRNAPEIKLTQTLHWDLQDLANFSTWQFQSRRGMVNTHLLDFAHFWRNCEEILKMCTAHNYTCSECAKKLPIWVDICDDYPHCEGLAWQGGPTLCYKCCMKQQDKDKDKQDPQNASPGPNALAAWMEQICQQSECDIWMFHNALVTILVLNSSE